MEQFHIIGENFIGTTGITNIDKNISLQVYPNPMNDYVIFDIQDTVFKKGYLELYNRFGQKVRIEKFREHTFEVKRKELNAGVYFFKLSLDDNLSATGSILILGH